jgi:hypothetical protein
MSTPPNTLRSKPPAGTALCACLLVGIAGCSGPKDGQVTTLEMPDDMTFPPVSDMLEVSCGTLDCHGAIDRNFRLYGFYGVRLSRDDVTGLGSTSVDEYQANYVSLISVAPEALRAIVASHGQGFDHWIVITKGTNAEVHKGGQRMKPNSPAYNCLKSWVLGAVDMNACSDATGSVMPPGGDNF